jgi:hypothetical protein
MPNKVSYATGGNRRISKTEYNTVVRQAVVPYTIIVGKPIERRIIVMDLSKELVDMLSTDRLNDPEDWKQPEQKAVKEKIEIDPEEQLEWNRELDALREGGTMNMYGAPRWLMENFEMSKAGAEQVFLNWTKTIEP